MQRKEAALLVSRALAVVQLIAACEEATYLPGRFMSLIHHSREASLVGVFATVDYWRLYYQLDIMTLVIRMGGLLILAVLFWNCGPWVVRTLLPKPEGGEESN
jgi:hypothetical protein